MLNGEIGIEKSGSETKGGYTCDSSPSLNHLLLSAASREGGRGFGSLVVRSAGTSSALESFSTHLEKRLLP